MLSFVNDYCEVCHEKILEKLSEIRTEKNPGYGTDRYCKSAADKIRAVAECPEADVYFISGGTQTNQLVIDTCLQPYEGVVSADSGHVGVHEAGAIEFSGHKVLTIPGKEGKLSAGDLENYVKLFYKDGNHEHMVFPGMVYISHPTEYGTLYQKGELEALRKVCDTFNMKLFLDGARLGYGLASSKSDLTLKDIAKLTDVFYIGGTKVGAMFGEAVVFTKNNTPSHFVTRIKQHGALLAKGWLLGLQFDVLFTDNLYLKIAKNALDRAEEIKASLEAKGYKYLMYPPTNQILIVLENKALEELEKQVNVSFWETVDDNHTAVRICTSWATTVEDVDKLIGIL